MTVKDKLRGFLLMPKSYFSLLTSPLMASFAAFLVGLRDTALLTILASFFLLSTAALNSFNNLMDARSDAITKKGFPIPKKLITYREAAAFSLAMFITATPLAFLFVQVKLLAGILMLTDLLLGFLYTAPKIRLKRLPIVKGIVLVAHTLILPLMITSSIIGTSFTRFFDVLIPLTLVGLSVHTLQDIGDVEGDRLMGDKTIPVLLGLEKTVLLTVLMFSAALLYVLFLNVELKIVAVASIIFEIILALLLLWFSGRWYQVFMFESLLSLFVLWALLSG